jgi:hypothetical protein
MRFRHFVDLVDGLMDTDGLNAVHIYGVVFGLGALPIIGALSYFSAGETANNLGALVLLLWALSSSALLWWRYRIVQRRIEETGCPLSLEEPF